jgi:hypothetical protein
MRTEKCTYLGGCMDCSVLVVYRTRWRGKLRFCIGTETLEHPLKLRGDELMFRMFGKSGESDAVLRRRTKVQARRDNIPFVVGLDEPTDFPDLAVEISQDLAAMSSRRPRFRTH